jgi:zinc transport system permease protein
VSRKGKISEDASIGIFFASSMALGIVLISLSKEYTVDLFGYLFGNILAITKEEVLLSLFVAVLVIGCILLFLKEIFMTTYSEEIARASGISVRAIISLLVLSVSIVISAKIVSIILIPHQIRARPLYLQKSVFMIALSCGFAVIDNPGACPLLWFDIAPGGSIVWQPPPYFSGFIF